MGTFMGIGQGALRTVQAKTADYVVNPDVDPCGKVFTTRGATAAVQFTLPAADGNSGLWYEFISIADQNITIATADEELVAYNDLTADSIAASTASEKIGVSFRMLCDGSSWIAQPMLGDGRYQTLTIASA